MTTTFAIVVLLGLAAGSAAVVNGARNGTLSRRLLLVLAGLCPAGLVGMTLSDWPTEVLNQFWADHSVLSATLTTLLFVGAGYFAFEAQENLAQQRLPEIIATAGFGGLVDHMLDIDLVMALLPGPAAPKGFTHAGRPLRWLRDQRDFMVGVRSSDPRWQPTSEFEPIADDGWRRELVDQAVRRVVGAMRDWAPLLGPTRDGIALLARVGRLRDRLLALGRHLASATRNDDEALATALDIRLECTTLALGLELASNVAAPHVRTGVLTEPPPALPQAASSMKRMQELAEHGRLRQLRSYVATH